ncbi:hydroxyacid dehydrogenase [Pseudorhodoplanes sp.]|uniref:hydroxyacid dehydrogenase n=1 Tax=Pseudorhodoplanes sp. TaxID=1934341 RepID=UPI002BEB32A5|nr:hydroxyacid dehydrogenase [Pseudorhodoplanes sp.]HWV53664.1 hydroxyacid dehydrogenase [Pseudorhodoplanes sp.]
MSARMQVSYIGGYIDPGFDRTIEACPDLSLVRIDKSQSFAALHSTLAASHAIQIDSARLDIPEHLRIGREFLTQCPQILVVSASGAGFDAIDVSACTDAGVIAVNQTGGNREAVAEHTLGMMLSLTKRIGETDKALRTGDPVDRIAFMGDDLYGKTVGIVGFGNTGTRVAELCAGLFAMTVLAYDPYVGANAITARGARKVELDELLRASDFVSLHCPLTAETTRMIGQREYAAMKPRAFFVTAARGGIHDEAALYEALKSGHLAGAGLDVWEQEPPPADHPLLTLPNVIASPHTAGVTHAARRRLALMAAEQLIDILRGGQPQRMLNPEALPRFRERFDKVLAQR